jgi:hypothetical protein
MEKVSPAIERAQPEKVHVIGCGAIAREHENHTSYNNSLLYYMYNRNSPPGSNSF